MELKEPSKHNPPAFTIFHFNDVYNIQPDKKEPKAGAAYFQALLQRQKAKHEHGLTLFSGDAFSPSLLSTQFEGENMIKPLNAFGIDLACFGNHDLDFELEHVMALNKQTNFPWLLSNIYDKRTGRRLAEGLQYHIITKNEVRIGIFSLAEQQWIDTLYPSYKEICEYIPFIDFAVNMVQRLKTEHRCDLIIALTHMMKYNDIKLAKQVKGIDLILGGHDHLVVHEIINQTVLIKSGSDFKNFSVIEVRPYIPAIIENMQNQVESHHHNLHVTKSKWMFEIGLKEVNHEKENIIPDPMLDHYIEEIYQEFKEKQEKIACYTKKDLDLRFATIRKEQNPFLQFFVSIYRHESQADCAIMNSGNFRMDRIVKAGPITFGIMTNVIEDKIVIKEVKGSILLEGLENCMSMYPNMSGRYSAFSGLSFTWDCSKKPGQRIIHETVIVHDKHLELDRIYRVAMHSFMGSGGDGYACFKQCPLIQREGDKINLQLIHDLLALNHYLLDSYKPKYPNRYEIIEVEGHKYLELNLPEPKNVHMIASTGHPYEH